jgi:superfamily II DNA helicase RecQ
MPKNIEGYYPETGRAGRDGQSADAWMAYGLNDVVNQRRMIDESPAADAFKQVLRGKLDALLSLAEASDCRRVRLLSYFGELSQPCGNCDNCLNPPAQHDATESARKLLSCIYRVQQSSGSAFGAGHIMDILRGKTTEKVTQHGHQNLSTFGIGADLSETQWRALIRQLIAREALHVDGSGFNTLHLTEASRSILRGETPIWLKTPSEKPRASPSSDHAKGVYVRTSSPGRSTCTLSPGSPLGTAPRSLTRRYFGAGLVIAVTVASRSATAPNHRRIIPLPDIVDLSREAAHLAHRPQGASHFFTVAGPAATSPMRGDAEQCEQRGRARR